MSETHLVNTVSVHWCQRSHACAVIKTVVRTVGRTGLWGGSVGSREEALDPPPRANSVALGELLSLPKA